MFKNPLKHQSGGSTPTQQQQDQLVQLFQAAAKNAQVDPEALVKKAQELGQDENAAAQFMEGLQKCAQGDPAGIQFIKSLFTPSHKHGGKIQDFICKHGKGGAVAGCGCEKPIEKHQQENGRGRGIIGALSGLYNRFIGQKMPDVPGINNRRVRTWTDANGIQHIVEDANINGNSTVTTIDINGADTLGTQKITTGDGRYRMVNLRPETPQWRSVMNRNIPQQENGGKVEKVQWGGITTGNERTNSNNRGQYWEDLTINPEFGRTYRLNVPGGLLNSTYIRHYSPNGTNKIKEVHSLPDDSWVKWSNLSVPGGKEYEWKDFYFNHMKKNVPQRLSNAQRLVPPMYDVKK